MMSKLKYLFILMSCFNLKQGLVAQIVPPPATQTEVNAGVNRFKYITPYTFANSSVAAATAASKQHGSFILTNFVLMGISNIVSANANTVITTNSGVLVLTSSGGSGSPGGTTTTIQYNQGGSFAGSSNYVYDQANQFVDLWGTAVSQRMTVGYTNGSTGITNSHKINGLYATSVHGTGENSLGITGAGVANTATVGTNYLRPGANNHADLGVTYALWRSLYLSSNAIVGGNLTVTGAVSVVGIATEPSSLALSGTNNISSYYKAANSNSVAITNIVGLLHKASASVIVLDCNHGNNFQITNQLGQATSLIVTNLAQGQTISISGDADGTSRVVTIIPHLGYLVRDYDAFGVAAAANKAITVTNGNTFEVSILAKWSFATNFADIVTRQAKY